MRKLLYILLSLPLLTQGQSIHITTSHDTVCNGLPVYFTATDTGVSAPYFQWTINGITVHEADSSRFTSDSLINGDSVVCLLTDSAHSSILAHSNGIIITVLPVPSAGVITGAARNVCVGATIALTDMVAGGVWSTCNNLATVTGGVVTGITSYQGDDGGPSSTDSIYYVVSNGYCPDTAYNVITVQQKPYAGFVLGSFPYGTDVLCVGEYLSIRSQPGGDPPNGTMYATNSNVYVSGVSAFGKRAGTDYIYCVATNDCGSNTYGETVTVYGLADTPTAIFVSANSVCVGSTITLSDTSVGAWRSSNDNALVEWNGILRGINPGLDTIYYVVSNQCGTASVSTLVKINDLPPIVGNDSLCKGAVAQFSDATNYGAWTSSNANVAKVDATGTVSGIGDGVATISYSLKGCLQTIDVTVAECGNEMKIYPNPAHEEVTIYQLDSFYNTYTFFNAIGQEVTQGPLAGPFTTVNVELLAVGFYTIVITGTEDRYVGKFVKD